MGAKGADLRRNEWNVSIAVGEKITKPKRSCTNQDYSGSEERKK